MGHVDPVGLPKRCDCKLNFKFHSATNGRQLMSTTVWQMGRRDRPLSLFRPGSSASASTLRDERGANKSYQRYSWASAGSAADESVRRMCCAISADTDLIPLCLAEVLKVTQVACSFWILTTFKLHPGVQEAAGK